jgi:peptidoglycan/xylan/chitin deacetylase (PgdA/CDA1 family)
LWNIDVPQKSDSNLLSPSDFNQMGFFVDCVVSIIATISLWILSWVETPRVRFKYRVMDRSIALTIDDGPSSQTPQLLECLRRHQIKATFFLIGRNAQQYPEIVQQIRAEGHTIGNHDLTNRASVWASPSQFEQDLLTTEKILGLTGRKYFRPGCGYFSKRLLDQVERHGYMTVLGNVYPLDPQIRWVAFLQRYLETQVTSGSIIILHDGPGRIQRTIETLNRVAPKLQASGYIFRTIDELDELEGSM